MQDSSFQRTHRIRRMLLEPRNHEKYRQKCINRLKQQNKRKQIKTQNSYRRRLIIKMKKTLPKKEHNKHFNDGYDITPEHLNINYL